MKAMTSAAGTRSTTTFALDFAGGLVVLGFASGLVVALRLADCFALFA